MSKLVFNNESYELVRLGKDITGIYQCKFKHNGQFVNGVEITEEVTDFSFILFKVYKDGEYITNYFINNLDFTIRDMVDIIQEMISHKLIKSK